MTISCEENLLCTSRDPYNEDIYIHELAHGVHLVGGGAIRNFDVAVEQAYHQAKRSGLWTRTYAISNSMEYFAEGVQSYFNHGNSGIEDVGPPSGNGNVNNINTRKLLFGYDFQETVFCKSEMVSRRSYIPGSNLTKSKFFIPNENRTKLFYLINRLFPCGNWISKRCTPRTTDDIRTNCPVPTSRINVEIEPLIEIDFDISKDYIKKCPADCNIGKLSES